MTAVHNLLLPFKRTRRIVGLLSFSILVAMAGSTYWLVQYDVSKTATLPVLGVFLLGLLALEAVPLLKPPLKAGEGLTLDGEGLAFTRKGRTVQWRWDEITDFRLRRPWHPASLLLGSFITFRVPADGRRAAFGFSSDRLVRRGTHMAIGNDYASWTHDIYAQIQHFQDAAAGVESPLGGELRIGDGRPPEPGWSFRKDRKQVKFWHVAGLVLGPVLGLAIASLIIHGLPGSMDQLLQLDSIPAPLFGALAGAPWLIVLALKQDSAQDNMLTLSAGGLSTRHKMERRHWLWWEISDIHVTQSTSRGKDGAAARVISFRAMQNGALPGKVFLDDKPTMPVSCAIDDVYEMPADDIARQVCAWWEWSRQSFGHPDDPEMAELLKDHISQQPKGISFLRQPGPLQHGSILEALIPWLALTPMAAYAGLLTWTTKAGIRFGIPWWGLLIGILVVGLGPLIGMLTLIQPGRNRLELDDGGLRFTRMGRASWWMWHDVGTAELRRVRSKWSTKQRTVLIFTVPADSLGSRILRWALNIDGSQPQIVLEDIYDTPLDEIAEALNDRHRRRGGRASRRPAT